MTWTTRLIAACVVLGCTVPAAHADEQPAAPAAEKQAPAKAPDPIDVVVKRLAESAEVKEALATFKVAFKAKGHKGGAALMHKEHALKQLAPVPHPRVVDAVAKIAKRDRKLAVRRMALNALAQMSPDVSSYAGAAVVELLDDKRLAKDEGHHLACLTTLAALKYLPSVKTLKALLNNKDYAVQASTYQLIGEMQDARLVRELLKRIGILNAVQSGSSWAGGEAHVDTGTAGDGDQRAAEAQARAEAAENAAAAGGAGGPAAGSSRDMTKHIVEALSGLTGQDFADAKGAGNWLIDNPAWLPKAKAKTRAAAARQEDLTKAIKRAR